MATEIQRMEKVTLTTSDYNGHAWQVDLLTQECGEKRGQLDQALREKKSLECELERVNYF